MNSFIPDNDSNWVIRNNRIYYKKNDHELVLEYIDNIVYLYFNIKIVKKTTKIIKHLLENNIKFYFRPIQNSLDILSDYNTCTIKSYLYCYVEKDYYYQFKKINFNISDNLVEWALENDCFEKIKQVYDTILKVITKGYYDYYSKKYIYDYDEEIRIDFSNLFRTIQIKLLLS
jgi:hypothetical protein